MTALVGVLLSYASLMDGASAAAGDSADICARGDACELSVANQEPVEYATPVEVDCRAMVGGGATRSRSDLPLFSSGCNQPAADFPYRVSRFPDSERSPGGFAPGHARRAARSVETCTGLPPNHGSFVSASAPPVAIYAYARIPLPPLAPTLVIVASDQRAPDRIVEPPDRPPRG